MNVIWCHTTTRMTHNQWALVTQWWRIHLQFRRCRRCRFHPWVGKIPWRRKWQPTPVVLPGKSHGQRSLVDYSPWGFKESNMTEVLNHHLWKSILWPALKERSQTWKRNIVGFLVYKVPSKQNEPFMTEKAWAPHSSTLAWKIPWTEEPGRLQSMGSHRVRHDWSDLAAAVAYDGLWWKSEQGYPLGTVTGRKKGPSLGSGHWYALYSLICVLVDPVILVQIHWAVSVRFMYYISINIIW